jgi:putative spermidine/putrescine transport system ATP-binding protein
VRLVVGADRDREREAAPSGPADGNAHTNADVRLVEVRKAFGSVVAVDGVSLDVRPGEFFALLGPSGSGKTTCLRMIAGFERPTSGRVMLAGRDVTELAPFQREVNTVFQDYALFPHMSVADNVGYGLRVRGVARTERRERVREALGVVRLADFGDRRPGQLSGGQRQRVALARALVNRPRVLLLDEPLGALDRKLREEMQVELKQLQRDVATTFVFVTHDQDEALTMSDRMAVFNRGRLEQVGTPEEVYERPATPFVADFIGTSNVVEGDVAQSLFGAAGTFSLRPERIRLVPAGTAVEMGEGFAPGTVVDAVYAGATVRWVVTLEAGPAWVVTGSADEASGPRRGDRVQLVWRKQSVYRLA